MTPVRRIPDRRTAALRIIGALLAITFLVATYAHVRSAIVPEAYRADFDVFYFGAVVEHHHPYTDDKAVIQLAKQNHRTVPPTGVLGTPTLVALVFEPLTLFDIHQAEIIWDTVTAGLVFVAVRSVSRKWWPLFLIALLATHSMLSGAQYASPSVVTFALLAFAYSALRDGKDRSAGIWMGVATAFKLYPGFLVIVLIAERRWNALKWVVICFALLTLASIPILGPSHFWTDYVRTFALSGRKGIYSDNNTFTGIAAYIANSFTAGRVANVIGVLAAVGLLLRFPRRRPEYTFAFGLGLMLLTQSLSWGHYYTVSLMLLVAVTFASRSGPLTATAWLSYFIAGTPSFTLLGAPSYFAPGEVKVFGLVVLTACLFVATNGVATNGVATKPADESIEKLPAS